MEKKIKIAHTDLEYQHRALHSELFGIFQDHLETSDFIRGDAVAQFEENFSSYLGADHAVGVGNGTDALELCLESLELERGSRVAVPANSFVASAEAVVRSGLTPVFVDVDDSMNISVDSLRAVSKRVSAVLAVHLYGVPSSIAEIAEFCASEGIALIEDCAQAHGALANGSAVGTYGKCAAFSFFPGKNLGALGDGGAVVTQDKATEERIRRLANHGRLGREDHIIVGRNSRLDSMQASFLSLKLRHLEKWNQSRRDNALIYFEELDQLPVIQLPKNNIKDLPVWHQFVIRVDPELRDSLALFLREKEIETRVIYPRVIPDTPAFSKSEGHWRNARAFSREILSLPIAEHLSESDIRMVARHVSVFVDKHL